MYVIRHQTSHTFFGINKMDTSRTKICCFPNVNDAKLVADNIARFHYSQNRFPEPENYKNLFQDYNNLKYENDFTPLKPLIKYEESMLSLDQVSGIDFVKYCANANLDVMFCILSKKFDSYRFYMYDMSLDNRCNKSDFLNKCYYEFN